MAVDPDWVAVNAASPVSFLIMPGRETIMLELPHASKVCDTRVVEDPEDAGGAALIVATDAGAVLAWDLAGKDQGQQYAEMRSLGFIEITLPPFMLFVSSMQVLSFAFGPTIPWNKEVHESATMVQHVTMFNLEYSFKMDRALLFWPKITLVICSMVLFILFALTDMPAILDFGVRALQNTTCYKAETSYASPCHVFLRFFKGLRSSAYLLIQFCATILVVPMFKACAQALDCMHPGGETGTCWPGECVLTSAKDITCYEGSHLHLTIIIFFVVPAYLFLLLPYAACTGDATYVPRTTLYDFKIWKPDNMWRRAARRKATHINFGFLHPRPDEAFRSQLNDLVPRIMLPWFTTLTTSMPTLQMTLVLGLGVGQLVETLMHPPFLEEKFLVVVQSSRLFTVVAFACGLLTVIIRPHTELPIPSLILGITFLVIALYVIRKLSSIPLRRPGVQVFSAEV
eukprot:gnl/TRDRNA2_/TRDRNA2_170747_c3_seq2.p1 gnl/TRDRNA2_/TRDRNA2_170747_c3~~gnl/TRDRNA2_/TRDRNA2_170747_c3_seq2.p1  ORF type:complete len:483 (+),score=59.44 gnl/TRDRNA2_/TRDRNA2_170747_c3_seq2:80-1450(+)